MKKLLLALALIASIASVAYCEKFSFVVFSDSQQRMNVFADLITKVNMEGDIDFGVNNGDLTDHGTGLEYSRYWDMASKLKFKIYECLGNHDNGIAGTGKKIFENKYGKTYYYFDYKGSRFIILDDSRSKGLGKDQWQWLREVLRTDNKKFIFMHRPLFDMTGTIPSHIMTPVSEVKELKALLIKSKVKYVFAGHIHGYGRVKENGIVYIITAGAGAPLYMPHFSGGFYNYVKVTVDENEIEDEVVHVYND
jgi:3',5'-cyclic AMP phosphodiesterase CpdA